ncbi:Pentatricopeptide repeat-containing protein, mitochondrial [Glycine soja]
MGPSASPSLVERQKGYSFPFFPHESLPFSEIGKPDKVALTAMLAGYAMHGQGKEAIEFFQMTVLEGMKPDHVTFALLSACSHSGLVKEGKVYRNINLGKEAAENLIALNPSDPRNYIMLSNIYSAAGLWSDASKVRALMKTKVYTRNARCSFIAHGKKICCFVVDDYSHPDSDKIHKKLEEIMRKIQEVGFVSETESILHDVDEEVKTDMINKHSEKIALAFGLLVSNADMPLVIIKNLQISQDCLNTAKFVSLIEKCTITIRDSKRFHHFSDASCSCGDYW